MSVETHLKELLYKHSRVVVPGFGTLMAHHSPANHNSLKHTLTPPRKKISFRPGDEVGDGLLLHRLEGEFGDSTRAAQALESRVSEWKVALENETSLQMEGIGTLFHTRDGSLQFASDRDVNYLPSSFGLPELELRPVEREENTYHSPKPTATVIREGRLQLKTAEEIEDEERDNSPLLPWLKYASMILLLISVALTAGYFYKQEQQKRERIERMANIELTGHIEESIFYREPLVLPPVEIEVKNKFHVVAGAYRLRENAERRLQDLRQQGFDARYLGKNNHELHQVAYGSFPSRKEAGRLLEDLKDKQLDSDAWILEFVLP